jgi:transcriptional regulator with XRE-family HTH domain
MAYGMTKDRAMALSDLRTIGARVRYMRQLRGQTQARLAEAARLSLSTIRAIENGRVRRPRQPTLLALSRGLMVEALWLVYGGD